MKKLSILFTVLFALSAMLIQAATLTAVVNNGGWNTAATWGGTVPSSAHDLVIPNGINVNLDPLLGVGSAGSLKIETGGSLTMTGGGVLGHWLNINEGGLAVTSGDLIMEPGSTINAGSATIAYDGVFSYEYDGISLPNFISGTSTLVYNGANTGTFSMLRGLSFGSSGHTLSLYNFTIDPSNGASGVAELSATTTTRPIIEVTNILTVVAGELRTNDNLTLKATSPTDFARVALNDNVKPIGSRTNYKGIITGKITMEKVFHANSLISAFPVTGGAYLGKWFQMCFPLQTTVGSADWTGITFNHAGSSGTARSIYWWDGVGSSGAAATGWTIAASADDQSKPYTAFLTTDGPFTTSSSISTTGTADLTDKIITVYNTVDNNYPGGAIGTDATGWNLIRNPWPTCINVDEMMEVPADFNTNYLAYHVYNTTADQYDAIPTSGFTTFPPTHIDYNDPDGYVTTGDSTRRIMPFQAFWIKTNSSNIGPINIRKKYASTKIDGNSVYMKTNGTTPPTAVVFAYDTDSMKDITLVYYRPESTMGFDLQGDLYKLRTSNPDVPTLFLEESGSSAQSAGRPHMALDTVKLSYASSKNNTTAYLHLNDQPLGSSYQVTLFDKVTQTTTNFTQNPDYMFTHNTNNPEDRFEMYITNNAIGIGESTVNAKDVKVYLSGDELVISSETFTGTANVNLYNLGGRLVLSRQVELTEGVDLRVQMASMAQSMYTVEVTYDGKVFVEKLVK